MINNSSPKRLPFRNHHNLTEFRLLKINRKNNRNKYKISTKFPLRLNNTFFSHCMTLKKASTILTFCKWIIKCRCRRMSLWYQKIIWFTWKQKKVIKKSCIRKEICLARFFSNLIRLLKIWKCKLAIDSKLLCKYYYFII